MFEISKSIRFSFSVRSTLVELIMKLGGEGRGEESVIYSGFGIEMGSYREVLEKWLIKTKNKGVLTEFWGTGLEISVVISIFINQLEAIYT